MASYKDLNAWQKSMSLAEEIYRIAQQLPKDEVYVLSDQMRRAAVSIPSNIAEGHGRNSAREFARFLLIAQGSKSESETQLQLCVRLHYMTNEQIEHAQRLCEEVGKMLRMLIRRLEN
ncbi:MAG: four helix bundle protein [Planctomycetes bacterium]|nr:four helix bundle protein [Planctomycetota bacterium]